MESTKEIIGLIAGSLSLIAYGLYLRAILKGTTKPSRVTWWILTLAGAVSAAAYYSGGARETIWVPLAYVIGPLLIAALSLRYGEGLWSNSDTRILIGALCALAVWYATNSPLWGLLINIAIDCIGIIPTIKKSFLRPQNEDRPAWTLEAAANIINLFAIESWRFEIWIYPIYLAAFNILIATLLYRRGTRR